MILNIHCPLLHSRFTLKVWELIYRRRWLRWRYVSCLAFGARCENGYGEEMPRAFCDCFPSGKWWCDFLIKRLWYLPIWELAATSVNKLCLYLISILHKDKIILVFWGWKLCLFSLSIYISLFLSYLMYLAFEL